MSIRRSARGATARLRGCQRPLRPGAGGPTSIPQTWDWCSGYHASDSTVIGFSHTHLRGTGIGDLFDVTVMPVAGDVTYARATEDDPASGLWSYADRTRRLPESRATTRSALTRYGITAELTATERVGLHRYTFPASDKAAAVVFDLENGGCWDKATETHLAHGGRPDAHRRAGALDGWAKDQRGLLRARSSRNPSKIRNLQPGEIDDSKMPGSRPVMHVWTSTRRREQVLAESGLSPVSVEARRRTLRRNSPDGISTQRRSRRRQGVER